MSRTCNLMKFQKFDNFCGNETESFDRKVFSWVPDNLSAILQYSKIAPLWPSDYNMTTRRNENR